MKGDHEIPWYGKILLVIWIAGMAWYGWAPLLLGLALLLPAFLCAMCLWGITVLEEWLDKK